MILQEGSWWMVFTALCLASLFGLLEYQGVINLIDSSEAAPLEQTNTADEMHPLGEGCLTTHDVAMHFHPYLTILIDGEEYLIPENTGIYTETCPEGMHMTHTHDASGKIHVEGHTVEEVPLEVFFDVWGKHFDETGIMEYRDGTVEMTVDGQISTDYQNHILADGQNIVISYTAN
jgi:hypothetical protein